MSARIAFVELRRSAAPVAGGIVALLGTAGLYVLATTGQLALWDGQWSMLAGYQRILLVLLWPLALGAGAWHGCRDRVCRAEELVGVTARPRWRRALPGAIAMSVGLAAGYAAIFAAGAVRVASRTSYAHLGWLPITLVGTLSLVAAGLLGLGVARLLPTRYTPPVLVLSGFAAVVLPPEALGWTSRHPALLLLPELLDSLDEFATVDTRVSAAQALWFGGIGVAGLALAAMSRRRFAAIAALPLVAGLIIALGIVRPVAQNPIVADPGALAEVCTHDPGPTVCVTRAHADRLRALTGPARKALAALAFLPEAPDAVHEVTTTGTQPADQVWLSADNLDPAAGPDELTARLLSGAGTQFCPGAEHYRARALAAAWLLNHYPAPGFELAPGYEAAARDRAWAALRALPEPEQRQRIAAVRESGRHCGDVTGALGL